MEGQTARQFKQQQIQSTIITRSIQHSSNIEILPLKMELPPHKLQLLFYGSNRNKQQLMDQKPPISLHNNQRNLPPHNPKKIQQ